MCNNDPKPLTCRPPQQLATLGRLLTCRGKPCYGSVPCSTKTVQRVNQAQFVSCASAGDGRRSCITCTVSFRGWPTPPTEMTPPPPPPSAADRGRGMFNSTSANEMTHGDRESLITGRDKCSSAQSVTPVKASHSHRSSRSYSIYW